VNSPAELGLFDLVENWLPAKASADVCRALRSFRLDNTLWIDWQLKNRRLLTFNQERQQHDLTVWEFKRVVVY
jgi:hypothetical protein